MKEEKNENEVGVVVKGGGSNVDFGGLRVLSLFDGISVLQQSLKELGIPVQSYVAVEIDKFARKITMEHFPQTVFFEDVRTFDGTKFKDIDLVVFGSPCVSFSNLGLKQGMAGKSGLFAEAVRILREVKPRFFIMENVNMKKEFRDMISETLGVQPILLDSSQLGSAQKRLRNIWTNLEVKQPEPNKYNEVLFQSIVENGYTRTKFARTLVTNQLSETESGLARTLGLSKFGAVNNVIFKDEKVAKMPPEKILEYFKENAMQGVKECSTSFGKNSILRVPNTIECERLMGLPDNYTSSCSMTQRYRQLGNAFCVHHFKHILSSNINILTNEI